MQTAKGNPLFFCMGFPACVISYADGPYYGAVRLGRRGILAFHHVVDNLVCSHVAHLAEIILYLYRCLVLLDIAFTWRVVTEEYILINN